MLSRTQARRALQGQYLFADFCQGWVRPLDVGTGTAGDPVATGFFAPVDIAVTRSGTIWVLDRQLADGTPGGLFRIDQLTTGGSPVITGEPHDAAVASGATTALTVYASGDAPVTYQWYRNGVAIAGVLAGSQLYPAP